MLRAATLIAVLCALAATPLPAQQAASPAVQPDTTVQPDTSATLSGPRARPEFARVEPAFPDSVTTIARSTAVANHTITITTLALVLVVVLLVLLIAD